VASRQVRCGGENRMMLLLLHYTDVSEKPLSESEKQVISKDTAITGIFQLKPHTDTSTELRQNRARGRGNREMMRRQAPSTFTYYFALATATHAKKRDVNWVLIAAQVSRRRVIIETGIRLPSQSPFPLPRWRLLKCHGSSNCSSCCVTKGKGTL
jgi:hypothetical protein